MYSDDIIAQTRYWLENLVLAHNLCPFAHQPYKHGRIRYRVSVATRPKQLQYDLAEELTYLARVSPEKVETTLLIHPHVLQDFFTYNHFLDRVDELLIAQDYVGIFQVASFHPDYQFADTDANAVENYTNRSPYPMLHLLREDSIEKAVTHYPDIEAVPERNIEYMRQLGHAAIQQIIALCHKK